MNWGLGQQRNKAVAATSVINLQVGRTRDVFLLTCAPLAQEGQWGHLSWRRGVGGKYWGNKPSVWAHWFSHEKQIHPFCLCSPPIPDCPLGGRRVEVYLSTSCSSDNRHIWLSLWSCESLLLGCYTGWQGTKMFYLSLSDSRLQHIGGLAIEQVASVFCITTNNRER